MKTKLTQREYIGTIIEVLDKPGYYKVEIPELVIFAGKEGIIVYDESSKTRYTNSKYGTYGYYYPLQKGTKVAVKFRRNNLTSGIIERIYTYEFPEDKIKHPNYYLIIKSLSNSKIFVDDDKSRLKVSFMNDTSFTDYNLKEVKSHAHNAYNIEATSVTNVTSPTIYLNGGQSPPDHAGEEKKGQRCASKFPLRICDSNLHTTFRICGGVKKKPKCCGAKLDNKKDKSDLNVNNLEQEKQSKIKSCIGRRLDIDTKSKIEHIYHITPCSTIARATKIVKERINEGRDNIYDDLQSRKNEINDFLSYDDTLTKYDDIDRDNITPLYKNLLDYHNELSSYINALYLSPEFNSLVDSDKDSIRDKLSHIYNILQASYSELDDIINHYSLSDTILNPNDFVPEELDSIFDSIVQVYNQLVTTNIIDSIDNRISDIYDKLIDRMNFLSQASKYKSDLDHIVDNIISNDIINNILDELIDFKTVYYDVIDNSNLNKVYQHKLFTQYIDQYLNSVNVISSKLKGLDISTNNILSSITPLSHNDELIIKDLFNNDFSIYVSEINSRTNIVRTILEDLKKTETHNDFFNKFDKLYQTINDLNNRLHVIKDHLSDVSHNFFNTGTVLFNQYLKYFNNTYHDEDDLDTDPYMNEAISEKNHHTLAKKSLAKYDEDFKPMIDDLQLEIVNGINNEDEDLRNTVQDIVDNNPGTDNLITYTDNIICAHTKLKNYLINKYYKISSVKLIKGVNIQARAKILYNAVANSTRGLLLRYIIKLFDEKQDNISLLRGFENIIGKSVITSFLISNYDKLALYVNGKNFDKVEPFGKDRLLIDIDNSRLTFRIINDENELFEEITNLNPTTFTEKYL